MKKLIPILFLGANVLLVQCGPNPSADKKQAPIKTDALQMGLGLSPEDALNKEAIETLKILHALYEKENPRPKSVPKDQPPYVQFSDIKKWKAAGDEHAAGYNANGDLLAIYDLTYQNTLSIEFIGRSILGTVGVGDMNLRELIRMLRNAIHDRQTRLGLGRSGPLSSDEFKKVNKVLSKIEAKYGDIQSPLVGEWWKTLPIKRGANGMLADPEVSFKLSDIDFESTMDPIQKSTYKQNLEQLTKGISDIFNIDASRLFEQLVFKRNASGNYDLVLNPTAALAPSEQPDKVVDLVRYKNSFGYAFLYLLIKHALTGIAGAIPHPAAAAVVKYAVSRWFELYEEQISFHRFRAYEYINGAERGAASPFAFLTAEQREKAGVYVLSHESSIFHTIFDIRDAAYFHKSITDELNTVQANTEWTRKRSLTLTPLSQLYFYGDDPRTEGMDFLLAMGGRPRFLQSPFVAYDYKNPEMGQFTRNVLKSAYDLLHAVKAPFPGVDYLMILLYDVFIMDDIRDAMRWEARFVSLMNQSSGKDFSAEIERIYAQRVNPFEFDLEEENDYVKRSKAYLGL